jgi:hypothetical protein
VVEEEEFEVFSGHVTGRNRFTRHLHGEELCEETGKYTSI